MDDAGNTICSSVDTGGAMQMEKGERDCTCIRTIASQGGSDEHSDAFHLIRESIY